MTFLRLGSLGFVALAVGGCVGQRYVNTTLYGPTGAPQTHTDPPTVAAVSDKSFNAVRLAAAPAGVQGAFQAEHAGAVLTGVTQRPAGNGVMLYEITYVDGGVARQALYRAGGEPAAETPVVIRAAASDDYRPAPNAARATTRPMAGGF